MISSQISIHALLAESDTDGMRVANALKQFQSTLSLRRATQEGTGACALGRISIHALLAESDPAGAGAAPFPPRDFNPRSPCGERRLILIDCVGTTGFQSTLSLRRATHSMIVSGHRYAISIHALLAESDRMCRFV